VRTAVLVSTDAPWALALVQRWAQRGDAVEVVLLDDAAATVRRGHRDAPLVLATIAAAIPVAVHDEALRRRGVRPDQQLDHVKVVSIDEIADLLADGADKVVWL
jgi:intracellular sulfur oxidation DsrE/DsrF family protein